MSCLPGRKNHRWTRYNQGLHTGAIKHPDDDCAWCGKRRFMVEAEKKHSRRNHRKRMP